MKRRIRLTEAGLRNLVARATFSVLNEMGIQEPTLDSGRQGIALDSNGRPKTDMFGRPVPNAWTHNIDGTPKYLDNGTKLDNNGRPMYDNATGRAMLDPLHYDNNGRPLYYPNGERIVPQGMRKNGKTYLDPTRYDAQDRSSYM